MPDTRADTTTRIDLTVLLPDVPDARDDCVARLRDLVDHSAGVSRSHVVEQDDGSLALCLHYDPQKVTLAQVQRLARSAGSDVTRHFGHAVLTIRAIDGEDADRRIESALRATDGVLAASVNLAAQRARVEFDRQRTTVDALRRRLDELGYGPVPSPSPVATPGRDRLHLAWYERNKELYRSVAAGVLAAVAFAAQRWWDWPAWGFVTLYLVSYVLGAFGLLHHMITGLRRGRFSLDIDLLMLLAAVGAATLGHWAEGAFLLFMFSLANALEHYALGRARNAIRALADLTPAVARVVRDGREVEVPVEQVPVGQVVLVRPAERIPVDGAVHSGQSAVDQAPITGESVPVDKSPGDDVFAGTINGEGALEVRTTRAAGDRTLDRVIHLVEEAQTQKSPTQRFTEKFEGAFVPAVLVAALGVIVIPPLAGLWDWRTSFYRGMALLTGASPCALALGTPAAVLAGIAQAARKGVLIKGGVHLENLGTIRAMALDKTGTLTAGRPEVTDVVPAAGATGEQLLRVAAAVERKSQHPLAKAVVRRAEAERLSLPDAGDLLSVTARGVRSSVEGQPVEIGSLRMWENAPAASAAAGAGGSGNGAPLEVPPDVRQAAAALREGGRSVIVVRHGDRWLGVLGLADLPRPNVRQVIDRFRAAGVRPLVMLTGDNRGVADAVAREVGVDEVRSDLLPEDKVKAVRELEAAYGRVAMVGDGVNDAPALAAATVGVAMGGAGTAAALETADVALMGDDLSKLLFATELSRRANAIIKQNLAIALGVIVLLIVATTTGLIGIGPAVFFHEGSTLVVIFNALRLLAFNGRS